MHLNEDQKLQVILADFQERYNASHKIRERIIKHVGSGALMDQGVDPFCFPSFHSAQ